MTGCAGGNCTNRSEEGYKLYCFPKAETRRRVWLRNCGRKNWAPRTSDRLCEVHFEKSQFFVAPDGQRRLIGTALPTLFRTPMPPKLLSSQRKSLYKQNLSRDTDENVVESSSLGRKKRPFEEQNSSRDTDENVVDSKKKKDQKMKF